MNDTEILEKLIIRMIEYNVCPGHIGLKDRADEFGEDACKKKYCFMCWKDALKVLNE